MHLIPKSPVVFLLVIVAFFAIGMLAGKILGKKKVEKFDDFDDSFHGELNTPNGMAGGPKVLPPVPENIGVVSGETMCKLANC